jgi:hypothetical protein
MLLVCFYLKSNQKKENKKKNLLQRKNQIQKIDTLKKESIVYQVVEALLPHQDLNQIDPIVKMIEEGIIVNLNQLMISIQVKIIKGKIIVITKKMKKELNKRNIINRTDLNMQVVMLKSHNHKKIINRIKHCIFLAFIIQ